MKKLLNINSIVFKSMLFLFVALAISCSNDDNDPSFSTLPAQSVTTYTGSLLYTGTGGGSVLNATTGMATISGNSGNYTISFSDGVPSVNNLSFISNDSGDTYAAVDISGSTVSSIGINGTNLGIEIVNGGNIWTFAGSR